MFYLYKDNEFEWATYCEDYAVRWVDDNPGSYAIWHNHEKVRIYQSGCWTSFYN